MQERDIIVNYLLTVTLYYVADQNGIPRFALYEDKEECQKICIPQYHIAEFKHVMPKL